MFCTRCGTELRVQDRFCSQCGVQIDPDFPARGQARLMRDMRNKKIAGVASGLARYFGVDAVLARILLVVTALCGGLGLVFYITAWIAMPRDYTVRAAKARTSEPAPAQ